MKHRLLSLLLLLPLPLPLAAEQPAATDKTAPVTIEADRMELDQKLGTSHYQGRVIMVQGALRIEAEAITLYSVEKKLRRAVAEGGPATLLQQGDDKTGPIRGEAAHMEYRPLARTIALSGQARLWRGGDEFSGEQINYNLEQQLVTASGAPQESGQDSGQGGGRVRVLLQPEDNNPPQQETP
ncbi:MAG: lipopolysaccharide transport periplasmic protein LptA [Gammaproteobacteria bacterium]|nr:lipopolysaccharide transport periplasmic protein LptA [Gammaproteobacteria bacterium]